MTVIQLTARPALYSIAVLVSLLLSLPSIITAFSPNVNKAPSYSYSSSFELAQAQTSLITTDDDDSPSSSPSVSGRSKLTLLEHVNLNVPNHDYIIEFYLGVLGMGLDPRTAGNVVKGEGMVWANCGASQFHLVYGEEPQVIPGSIGLWYHDLAGLKERLRRYDDTDSDSDGTGRPFDSYTIGIDGGTDKEHVRILDQYGNVFYCRQSSPSPNADSNELIRTIRQPLLTKQDVQKDTSYRSSTPLLQHAMESPTTRTDCGGIAYVEFDIPRGTAESIAEFYECAFDAPTNVLSTPDAAIAIVGFGSVDAGTGRASQSLVFRESDGVVPVYDGHHVAMYVGEGREDYERVFGSCMDAGVVWVNPRFSDRVVDLTGAKKLRQFRFKDVLDLETGKRIFELEHEVRSVHHGSWPGEKVVE